MIYLTKGLKEPIQYYFFGLFVLNNVLFCDINNPPHLRQKDI